MKIFFLGFNKTATCTIHQLLIANGINAQHDSHWDLDNYDAFSDCGDLQDYRTLHQTYPDAYFILNIREERGWLLSRLKHGKIYKQSEFGHPEPTLDLLQSWHEDYQRHHKEVIEYFKDAPRFHVLKIEGSWKKELAEILGLKNYNTIDSHKSEYFPIFEEYKKLITEVV